MDDAHIDEGSACSLRPRSGRDKAVSGPRKDRDHAGKQEADSAPPDDEQRVFLQEREALKALDARLKKAREHESDPFGDRLNPARRPDSAQAMAWRISVEIVVALGVCGFIGWWLDKWFDTKPWLMVVFLLLGFGVGIRNVYRIGRDAMDEGTDGDGRE